MLDDAIICIPRHTQRVHKNNTKIKILLLLLFNKHETLNQIRTKKIQSMRRVSHQWKYSHSHNTASLLPFHNNHEDNNHAMHGTKKAKWQIHSTVVVEGGVLVGLLHRCGCGCGRRRIEQLCCCVTRRRCVGIEFPSSIQSNHSTPSSASTSLFSQQRTILLITSSSYFSFLRLLRVPLFRKSE